MHVRLLKNQDGTRVELDGEDITARLSDWAITVTPGEPSRVVLRGGLWSYEGDAEVTVEYEHAPPRSVWPHPHPRDEENAHNASL